MCIAHACFDSAMQKNTVHGSHPAVAKKDITRASAMLKD